MTISTDSFDLIFSRRNKIEARIEKLQRRIGRAESAIENLQDKPVTPSQHRKLGRFEGLLGARTSRLLTMQYDLEELNSVELPMDELNIIVDSENSTYGVSFQESPYDDLINPGDYIKVGLRASREGKSFKSTQLSINHPDYDGDKYVLGDSLFEYSGLRLRDFSDYTTAEVFVEVNGVDVQTLSVI